VSDCKFATAKKLVPEILDLVDIKLLCEFFHKIWQYMDTYEYRKGLDVRQVAFAVKLYKSHRRIGAIGDVIREIEVLEKHIGTVLALSGLPVGAMTC
jgi:hypothetical protein